MLTDKTQAAIAALRAVAYCVPHSSPDASPSVPVRMLRDLEDCGLIRLLPGGNPSSPGSYELCRSFSSLSLRPAACYRRGCLSGFPGRFGGAYPPAFRLRFGRFEARCH